MKLKHIGLAVLTTAIWGTNFAFIKIGLIEIPPFLLCFLRFFFASVPFVFFIRRPQISWKLLGAYGLFIFAGQFGFLFSGMKVGVPAGLSSLVLQTQVFFTLGLSAWLLSEKPSVWKCLGAVISFSGIALVGFHTDSNLHLGGLALLLCGAFCWALGNLVARKIGVVNALGLVVWGSLITTPVVGVLAIIFEGPTLIVSSITHLSWTAGGSLIYIVYVSTLLGFSFWSILLRKYPAPSVAPFTLLVPVFGFFASLLFLGEDLPAWKLQASLIVVLGLSLSLFGGKTYRAIRSRF